MDIKEKQILINKLVCNKKIIKYDGVFYTILYPTPEQKVIADIVYEEILEDNKYEPYLTSALLKNIQQIRGIWTEKDEAVVKQKEQLIEELKIQLYNNWLKKNNQPFIRKQLAATRIGLDKLEERKREYELYTIEYHATSVRDKYLLGLNIMVGENYLFTPDSVFMGDSIIERIQQSIYANYYITPEIFREIARSEPWRSTWTLDKNNFFQKEPFKYTNEQKYIVMFSKMYDSAMSYQDPPPDSIINDDDMFDGWLLKTQKDQEKEQQKRFMESKLSSGDKGDEVFIVTDKENAGDIYELNDFNTRMKIMSREKFIKSHDAVEGSHLPDIQMQLNQQAHTEFKNKIKGK